MPCNNTFQIQLLGHLQSMWVYQAKGLTVFSQVAGSVPSTLLKTEQETCHSTPNLPLQKFLFSNLFCNLMYSYHSFVYLKVSDKLIWQNLR